MQDKKKTLIVIVGPTGVGKTEFALQVAEHFGVPIVNADSRQIYRDIPICTAAPTADQLARVKHYFVGTHSLDEPYSAAQFEEDALSVLNQEFGQHDVMVMSGGSMMYIDAVVKGIDEMPDVDTDIRQRVYAEYEAKGIEFMRAQLKLLDPVYYAKVDLQNPKRVIHGIEMCLSTGRPFSSFHTGRHKERPFDVVQIGLCRERSELYARIDARVRQMLDDGLLEEARRVLPQRTANALNTVGMKEMFMYLDGTYTLEQTEERICHNTHIYSKKQMTWFKKDLSRHWFHPEMITISDVEKLVVK